MSRAISEIDEKLNEKKPLQAKLRLLKEQKRVFTNAVENELIDNIRSILELPENYIALTTANDINIAKPISEALEPHVQKYQPKSGNVLSPSKMLEYEFNLYIHESSNVAGKTLAMVAVENTYSTLFSRIGAYLQNTYEFQDSKGNKQTRRMDILLPHHKFRYKDAEGKEWDGISLSNLYDTNGEYKVSEIISQIMNGLLEIEKDTWISNLQGNTEIMPALLFLLKTGVPIKEAAWFVSQPLVRDYVDKQRLFKSTYAGPLGESLENANFFRYEATKQVLQGNDIFKPKDKIGGKDIYTKTQELTSAALASTGGKFTQNDIETVVKTQDRTSDIAHAGFLHFLELEEMMKGIRDLKFKTNLDTKKSPDLYNAVKRVADIEALAQNSRIPSDMIDKILESVLGSFFIQDFQIKLWSRLFPFRTDEVVTDYITHILKKQDTQDFIQNNYGQNGEEAFIKTWKNDLVSFIFQNHLKGFNLRTDSKYKGYSVKDSVPIKSVDFLPHGAFVKEGIMYVDKAQINKDWDAKLYTQAARAEDNSYTKRGLATLSETTFTWEGPKTSRDEFAHFVIEREYLRSITPKSEIEGDYEEYLRDKALKNIFNYDTMFKGPNSVANEFLKISVDYEKELADYSLISSLSVSSDRDTGMSNITLKDKDLDSYKQNNYYENYTKLSDPGVIKVKDPKENMRISNFFRDLSVYAYIQSGISKNKYSITDIVSPKAFQTIMAEPLKEFTKKNLTWKSYTKEQATKKYTANIVKMLDTNPEYHTVEGRIGAKKVGNEYLFNETAHVLDIFTKKFEANNTKDKKQVKARFKDYVIPNLSNNILYSNPGIKDFSKTNRPDIFTFDSNIKGKELVELGARNSNMIFAFNDTYNASNKNILGTNTEMDMRQLPNAFGIRTSSVLVKGPWGTKTQEHVKKVKGYIDSDLAPLIEAKKMGKEITFPSQGLGTKLQSTDPEVFIYLSKRLFEEFGYVNPGSIKELTVRDLVEKMQGISQNEVEELKRQCIYDLPK